MFAGFESSADIIITMDADLQNPPEEIPNLVKNMEKGILKWSAHTQCRKELFQEEGQSRGQRMTSASRVKLHDWGCMLRAYRRKWSNTWLNSREHSTFIPRWQPPLQRITESRSPCRRFEENQSILARLSACISTDHLVFESLEAHALPGLFPWLGGVGFGIFLATARLYFGALWAAQGVFTLFAVLFFFVGAQFLAFGIMGEYVGRIYREVKRRPPYTIRRIY